MKKVLVLCFIFIGTYFSGLSQLDSILFLGEYFYKSAKDTTGKSLLLFHNILKDPGYEKKLPYYREEMERYKALKEESNHQMLPFVFRTRLWEIWRRSPQAYEKMLLNIELFNETKNFKNPLDDLAGFLERYRTKKQYVY